MNIMVISSIFPPGFIGGYELAALDIARGLKQKGHNICVVTSDYFLDYEQSLQDFPVHRILEWITPYSQRMFYARDMLNESFFFNFRNIRLLSNLLIRFKPDAVLVFDSRGLGTLGLLKYLVDSGYKPILNLGDNVFQIPPHVNAGVNFVKYCSVFGSLDFLLQVKCIALSNRFVGEITETLGFQLPHITVLPRWYKEIREKLQRKNIGNETRFVFASSLLKHKGIYIIIEAVKKIVSLGEKNFIVDLYGNGEVSEVIYHIAISGLEHYIKYCKVVSREELPEILNNYDALLFPTQKREPFGAIVVEAAAAGCVPIMTTGVGAGEWYLDGIDCMKINQNETDLAAAMIKFIRMSREDKTAMSSQSTVTTKKFFNFSDILNDTERLIFLATEEQQKKKLFSPIKSQAAMLVLKDVWEKNLYEK